MRRQYWNCEVQKNWTGMLREEMLAQNIVCYGKTGTGKTQKVIMPFLRQAIARHNSVLLITNHSRTDYSEILEMARGEGYEEIVENFEVFYSQDHGFGEIVEGNTEILEWIMAKPVLVRVQLDPKKKFQFHTVDSLLIQLASEGNRSEPSFPMRNLSLVIEDSDWSVTVPRWLNESRWVNMCITMDSARLNPSDLTRNRERSLNARQKMILSLPTKNKTRIDQEQICQGGFLQFVPFSFRGRLAMPNKG